MAAAERTKMFGLNRNKNILVFGHEGMLGRDVYERFSALSRIKGSGIGVVTGLGRSIGLDFFSRPALDQWMDRSVHYDWCVNCAAYTDTSAEENTAEGRTKGYMLNALLPRNIAEACERHGTRLVHVSTDYVFSEHSVASLPSGFCPSDTPFPKNEYGLHKLLGEIFVRGSMKDGHWTILRTSWLYSTGKSKSFVHKFLKNCLVRFTEAAEKPVEVDVTCNEYSVPTSCTFLVRCIEQVVREKMHGVLHAVPYAGLDAAGVSRYEFADAILTRMRSLHLQPALAKALQGVSLRPAVMSGYHPKRSAMSSSFKFKQETWQECLDEFLCQNIGHIEDYCMRILDGLRSGKTDGKEIPRG